MNDIIKYGKNFIAISNSIKADCHKHWLIQMFLSSKMDFNIEVNNQIITCSAILVNLDTPHAFKTEGETHFTMLIDPTTELGCMVRGLLEGESFYVFPYEKTLAMQQAFKNALLQKRQDAYLVLIRDIISQFTHNNMKKLDDRVTEILELLENCDHEEEFHQINYFSKKIALSESRLAHLFKEEIGIPLKSYIVLHKLQRAYEYIFNGENITTAAANAGFDSPSHLAYTNKMMTGMSTSNIIKDSEFLKVF
jgi:AraC-like DNA-binding protein